MLIILVGVYLAVLYKINTVFCHYISWNVYMFTILHIFLSAISIMTSPLLWTWRADRERIHLVSDSL